MMIGDIAIRIFLVNRIIFAVTEQVIAKLTATKSKNHCLVRINPPTDLRIIISTLQIIQPDFYIVVVTSVSEGVNNSNGNTFVSTGDVSNGTPSVVGVSCLNLAVSVCNSNNITLQVLEEVVRCTRYLKITTVLCVCYIISFW